MTDRIISLEQLQERLGVSSWPDLTKKQTFELLKLAGEEKLVSSVLSKLVELAPTLQQLSTECFETLRSTAADMRGSQQQALAILDKAIDSFDRFRASLLEAWKTVNDPDRIASLIKLVSTQMVEILLIVERMSAENNRSWWDMFKLVGGGLLALIAIGGSVAAGAQRRS